MPSITLPHAGILLVQELASDCPFVGCEREVTYQQTVDWLVGCVPDLQIPRRIFGETALGFYFGGSTRAGSLAGELDGWSALPLVSCVS